VVDARAGPARMPHVGGARRAHGQGPLLVLHADGEDDGAVRVAGGAAAQGRTASRQGHRPGEVRAGPVPHGWPAVLLPDGGPLLAKGVVQRE